MQAESSQARKKKPSLTFDLSGKARRKAREAFGEFALLSSYKLTRPNHCQPCPKDQTFVYVPAAQARLGAGPAGASLVLFLGALAHVELMSLSRRWTRGERVFGGELEDVGAFMGDIKYIGCCGARVRRRVC